MPHKMTKKNGTWSLSGKDGKEVTSGSLATVMRADYKQKNKKKPKKETLDRPSNIHGTY